jgi:hypothetical protein
MRSAILNELSKRPLKRHALRKALGLTPGKEAAVLSKELRALQAARRIYYSINEDRWHLDEGYVGPPDTYLG